MLSSRYLVAQFRNKVAQTLASLSVNFENLEKTSPQPNVLAIRMAMIIGKIIDVNYINWSEAEVKYASKKFTELVDAGMRTAKKKADGSYEPLYPEFSSWVLNTDFRFDGTKRMLDYVKSVEFPTLKDGPVYENDYVKDCPAHPKKVASSIPPAAIAERIIVQSLYSPGEVQTVFDGVVNGGTWPYASDEQKQECARIMRAFGFGVTYKAKKEAQQNYDQYLKDSGNIGEKSFEIEHSNTTTDGGNARSIEKRMPKGYAVIVLKNGFVYYRAGEHGEHQGSEPLINKSVEQVVAEVKENLGKNYGVVEFKIIDDRVTKAYKLPLSKISLGQREVSADDSWYEVSKLLGYPLTPDELGAFRDWIGDETYYGTSSASTPDELEGGVQDDQDIMVTFINKILPKIPKEQLKGKPVFDQWGKEIKFDERGNEIPRNYSARKFPLSVSAQVGTAKVEIRDLTSPSLPTQSLSPLSTPPEETQQPTEEDLQALIDQLSEDKVEGLMEKEGDSGITVDESTGDMPSPLQTDVHGNPNVGATDQTGKLDEKIRALPTSMEAKSTILARAQMLLEFLGVSSDKEAKETLNKYAKKLSVAAKITHEAAINNICANLEVLTGANDDSLAIYNKFYKSARVTKAQHVPEASIVRSFEAALPQYSGNALQRLQELQMKVETSNDPKDTQEYQKLADIWSGLHARGPVSAQAVTPVQQPTQPMQSVQPVPPAQPAPVQPPQNANQNILSALQEAINQANQNNDPNSAAQLTDVFTQKMQDNTKQTPNPIQPTASLKFIQEAAKRGEYLTIDEIFRFSPIAAKKMKDAGLKKVKAEYLLKRVLPYLEDESDGLTD